MISFIIVLLTLIALNALSWLGISGIIWLICKCFGLQFSWKIATGIWLILMVLKSVFKHDK